MRFRTRYKRAQTRSSDHQESPSESSAEVLARPPLGSMASRMLLTLIGAAAIIIGGLLTWVRPSDVRGDAISFRAFATPGMVMLHHTNFWTSAGFIMILCGAVAIFGLVLASGWITRTAGTFGLIGSALFLISMHRANESILNGTGPGLWLALGGSVVTVVGGLFSLRPMVIQRHHPMVSA
ncbi:MAG: hypothetical protein ACYDCC_00600 [Actinomycetota bacterium]